MVEEYDKHLLICPWKNESVVVIGMSMMHRQEAPLMV